ncbi:MAG: methyltransferase domain-containing protein [Gammaproteobacteria bacterium]|nr:methyltransferase domain-containing protein [Gammaproteobacteria bacterium]
MDHLELIRIEPRQILDVGCRTGQSLDLLARRFPKARLLALELSAAMLKRARGGWLTRRRRPCLPLCASLEHLPLNAASVDLVHSNLALAWTNSPDQTLAECRRILMPGGLLVFSTLGPDTLKELRRAPTSGARQTTNVHPFLDMHDVGDALVRAGYADVVMDAEVLDISYRHLDALHAELRSLGATNVLDARPRTLSGRGYKACLEQRLGNRDGKAHVSIEVIYGHAWSLAETPATKFSPRSIAPITVR